MSSRRNARRNTVVGAIAIALGLTLATIQRGASAGAIAGGALLGFVVALAGGWFFSRIIGDRLNEQEPRPFRWTRRDAGVIAIGFGLAVIAGLGAFALLRAAGASTGDALGPATACFLASLVGGLFLGHRTLNGRSRRTSSERLTGRPG
jgi:hypothetical protein